MRKMALVITVVLILLVSPFAAGFSVTGGSARFLMTASPGTVKDLSLELMALASAKDKVSFNATPEIVNLSYRLVSLQNPDGGWGYFPGSVSSVPDTSYAVVALQMAIKAVNDPKFDFKLYRAVRKGVEYIKSSRSGNAWGYVPDSIPMYYPTVTALWALGESGYGPTSSPVSSALPELERLEKTEHIPAPEGLALKVFALKAVGYPVSNSTVDKVRAYLFNGTLNVEERAMLTYALVLCEGTTFDALRAVSLLENSMRKAGDYAFWVYTTDVPPATFDAVAPTSYALLALSSFSPSVKLSPKAPCTYLSELQNPDGGWGFRKGEASNAEATYYALTALRLCYPLNSSFIKRGIEWIESDYPVEYRTVESNERISPGYFYALESMLKFGLMNRSAKERAITLIESVRLKSGLWGSRGLGPEPFDTALAVRALLDLGVSPSSPVIRNATSWLLSISSGGWGIYYGRAKYPYMVDENVLTTLTVLEALKGVVNSSSLRPHLEWLLNQRIDGGWPYMRNYTVASGNLTYTVRGTPRLDLTVRATLLLRSFGYNYVNDTLSFVLASLKNGTVYTNTLYLASAVEFLLLLREKPPVTLADVSDLIRKGMSKVYSVENVSPGLRKALSKALGGSVSVIRIARPSQVSGPSIVIVPFKDADAFVRGNPYFNLSPGRLSWASSSLSFNASDSILMIPGLLPRGPVLFVVCDNQGVLSEVISTGYLRYMQGYAALITFSDRNHDGKIELGEISLKSIG
ncbi:MAG: terpene cyclase/mutase family protein [Thermococci archaeon]|nr:terpene cyclase/mutase family protein [Thermococci archaeon]